MAVAVRSIECQARGWSLTASAAGIEHRRRQTAVLLQEWGATQRAVEMARLGVSELLSNVVKHAVSRRCSLRVSRIGADAVVQVFDQSKDLPVIERPDWMAEGGRGLWLLREMADGFGYMPKPYTSCSGLALGKVVWFSCWGAFPSDGTA
ncbi:ATP-binding protein [Streptomyces sp. DSM 44915]|uniref:ATP-binding protein n=1 Tax=Streptomyces chisholmiae TaxID=3075540 RepID=A0ABU2JWC9_9ACTN|nr:ATP-binding protein [Streptomyces sp. DSM 44915]MDT0269053.1 ATP-binding protein [Streptomyces sp. DSM 44915]